jgi:hypothetical protein
VLCGLLEELLATSEPAVESLAILRLRHGPLDQLAQRVRFQLPPEIFWGTVAAHVIILPLRVTAHFVGSRHHHQSLEPTGAEDSAFLWLRGNNAESCAFCSGRLGHSLTR